MMQTTDLSPLSAPGVVTQSALRPAESFRSKGLKPPRGLHLPRGPVSSVRFGGHVPTSGGRTVAQKMGLAYEAKVHDILEAIYDVDYRRSPAVLYEDRSGLHRIIPDGILKIGQALVIVEVKLRHCEKAWWQLERVYKPILRALALSGTPIQCVEVCRSYDPDEPFPGPHTVVTSLHRLPPVAIGVLQWKL